jgi:chromosome partitioning protein
MSMKTLVLANQKGGVGKSAVATLLSHHLVRTGHRVLAIDFDHQANLTNPIVLSKRACVSPVTSDQLLTASGLRMPNEAFVLVPAADALMGLERQPAQHTPFARNLRDFLRSVDAQFDVCVIDTNPSPDIRVIAALAVADHVLSPIQLNQEAIDGVRLLMTHPRVGCQKIKAVLNPRLSLIGLLPTLVEPTPFQKSNFVTLIQRFPSLLIPLSAQPGDLARIPKRSAIAEAQAEGQLLWEMKKTAARDAWSEIEPTLKRITALLNATRPSHAV